MRGTGAPGLRRGPYKTSQVGPFCLAASFLWIQQECGLRNLAPVAWHLVKLIHRQETNCQIKWVSSSLPSPSRLACGWDGTAFLPLFFPLLFSRHVTVEGSALSCNCTRGTISRSRGNDCLLFIDHQLDNRLHKTHTHTL